MMTKQEKQEVLRDVAELLRDVLESRETPQEADRIGAALDAVLAI